MSDNSQDSPNSSTSTEPTSAGPKSAGGGHKGLFIVLGIIAVALAAFCYDTFVVPGTVQAGFDKIADAKLKSLVEEKPLSSSDVCEILGKEPAESYEKDDARFEVFHWTGGMIVNSHKLFTVYEKLEDDWVLDYHTLDLKETDAETFDVVTAPAEELGSEYEEETMGVSPSPSKPEAEQPESEQPEVEKSETEASEED